ncbi:hypothetical protein [Mycobacterium sp. 23]|uniref:hypothetical protein n=1 Tax=Mycobacterium sp. 23 TaxID=3400424 RepID=UPI003AABB58B
MANECIPLYRPGLDITAVTTGAVTGKTFVDYSAALTTGLVSVNTATAAGKVAGVAAYDAASGARVAVIRGKGQIVPVTAGGTISALAEVEVGSGGKAVAYSAGVKVGRALSAGSNNNDVFIELY